MQFRTKTAMVFVTALLLLAPITFILLPASGVVQAAGKSRAPNVIATTLAFTNGQVVTVQYSNIYFCNSSGPPTSSSSSPCVVGTDATTDPVPDTASATLDVIVPAFLPPLCGIVGVTCLSGSDLSAMGYIAGSGGGLGSGYSNTVLDASLGANDLTQCPDNPVTLTCPNHPDFLDLTPVGIGLGVIPLPIHSHVLSGFGGAGQGGWWKLRVWLVLDPSIWPNPNTGSCPAGTGCLTSLSALTGASGSQVVGPVLTTIYLHFNIVSSSSK
ncbi:MAG TPA: hypothetical protein VFE91_05560 [Nitrososphaerales archaeon]|nr:hypothetical protein [Nitrososphaerales archaeon]